MFVHVCVLMGMLMQFAGLFHKMFIVLVWPAVSTERAQTEVLEVDESKFDSAR